MKMKRSAYFSIGFLFLFLASFSTNTFISLNSSFKKITRYTHAKEITPGKSWTSSSEDLMFEETEDDCEDSTSPLQTILPSFLNFQVFIQKISIHYSDFFHVYNKLNSLFLTIRVIRI
jgi:hypothetical protein